MAPGPSGTGRPTGTVPKTKSFVSPRHLPGSPTRLDQSRNHVSNNLSALDFQPVSESGNRRTRKRSNTQPATSGYFDLPFPVSTNNMDGAAAAFQEATSSGYYGDTDELQGSWRKTHDMNGHDAATGPEMRDAQRTPQNIRPDRETKPNNITKGPDRNQVASRLNQIRDYIKQTSSLVNTLKNSGDPRQLSQCEKLTKLVIDLQDSEVKLQRLLNTMNRVAADLERHEREMPEFNESYQMQRFSQLLEVLQAQDREYHNLLQGQDRDYHNLLQAQDRAYHNLHKSLSPVDHASNSPSLNEVFEQHSSREKKSNSTERYSEPYGAVLKSSDSTRSNELKIKVEESQRKLQALQDHQVALVTLQQKFQNQLQSARAAQGILAANIDHSGDRETSQDKDACSIENLQDLNDRLSQLVALCDTHNEVDEFLGPDEDMDSAHMELRDKLHDLQTKKQQLDILVSQFHALNADSSELSAQSSNIRDYNENSAGYLNYSMKDDNVSTMDSDLKSVRDKVAELNMMKAELARLQGLSAEISRADRQQQCRDSAAAGGSDINEQEEAETEEQAVNLRRQKEKSRSSVARSNSSRSTSSNKQDNIAQAISEMERRRELEKNTMKLKEARSRYENLQHILSLFTEAHDLSLQRSDELEHLLNEGRARGEGVEESSSVNRVSPEITSNRSQRQRVDQQSLERNNIASDEARDATVDMIHAMTNELQQQTMSIRQEQEKLASARMELAKLQSRVPVREKKTNTQVNINSQQHLLANTLRSKRNELEEFMKKDKGQSSALNQDILCDLVEDKSDAQGYSYLAEGTTNATWGESTEDTIDDFAEQDNDLHDHSAGYSSEEILDEEEDDEDVSPNQNFPPVQLKMSQLKNSANKSNVNSSNTTLQPTLGKDVLAHSTATNRDLLSMSLDSGHVARPATVNTPPPRTLSSSSRQDTLNVWRRDPTDTVNSRQLPVTKTPSSRHSRQGRESNNLSPNVNIAASESNHISHSNIPSSGIESNNLWHQQTSLQTQMNVPNNITENVLPELPSMYNHNNHSSNIPPSMFMMNPMLPPVSPMMYSPMHTSSPSTNTDVYYQQLLTISQLQQHHMLFSTVNQCCHLLWMQQRELASLRASLQLLHDKISPPSREISSTMVEYPTEHLHSMPSANNNIPRLPHMTNLNPVMKPAHRNVASSGVTSAHSLPNLSGMMPNNVAPPQNISSVVNPVEQGYAHNYIPSGHQPTDRAYMPSDMAFGFPISNLNYFSSQPPLPSLVQPAVGNSWLHPGSATTPTALNNQVPPGNRANNYWDNFRSNTRQNFLSTSNKMNDSGVASHSPSPLVDRSHNSLRQPAPPPVYSETVQQGLPAAAGSRKENLNVQQYQPTSSEMFSLPAAPLAAGASYRYEIIGSESPSSVPHSSYNTEVKLDANVSPLRYHVSSDQSEQNMKPTSSSGATKKKRYAKPSAVQVSSNVPVMSEAAHRNLPEERTQENVSLFDIMRDPVYNEVAALISVNENRPHFLIQLFRDLQMISSDSLRQRILQAIHELVSQYVRSSNCEEDTHDFSPSEIQLCTESVMMSHPEVEEDKAVSYNSSDVDNKMNASVFLLSGSPSQILSRCGFAHLLTRKDSHHSWTENQCIQQNEAPNKLYWEVEAVLRDLRPFLKAHTEDMCSPSFLETVRRLALQLLPIQNLPLTSVTSCQSEQSESFFQAQLDAVLEDALLKFQGNRLGDVDEDLLAVVSDIMQNELMFLRHISRAASCGDSASNEFDGLSVLQEPVNLCGVAQVSSRPSSQPSVPTDDINQGYHSTLHSGVAAESYNGDLAEADQSCHENVDAEAEREAESAVDVIEEEQISEAEGIALVLVDGSINSEIKEERVNGESVELPKTEHAEEEWEVEEDRGLDQIPSRLETATEAMPDGSPTHSTLQYREGSAP